MTTYIVTLSNQFFISKIIQTVFFIKHPRIKKSSFPQCTFAIFTLHTFFLHNTIQGIERKKDEKMVLSFISCFIYLMFDLFVRKKTDLS